MMAMCCVWLWWHRWRRMSVPLATCLSALTHVHYYTKLMRRES
jgi:hypothetical protein